MWGALMWEDRATWGQTQLGLNTGPQRPIPKTHLGQFFVLLFLCPQTSIIVSARFTGSIEGDDPWLKAVPSSKLWVWFNLALQVCLSPPGSCLLPQPHLEIHCCADARNTGKALLPHQLAKNLGLAQSFSPSFCLTHTDRMYLLRRMDLSPMTQKAVVSNKHEGSSSWHT